MADKKKKPKKKPDGRTGRPRDPNQLALWVVEQSTSKPNADDQSQNPPAGGRKRD